MRRPFKRMKGYIQFFKQKDIYKELDNIKIHRWSEEMLKEEEKKVKRRMKIIKKFEKWPRRIMTGILVIICIAFSMVITQKKEYWVAILILEATYIIYTVGYGLILVSDEKARKVTEKNDRTIKLEKARRVIGRHDYSKVETIDSPELCAILAKAIEPRIDEIRYADLATYNVYIQGRCYRMKLESKLEEKIKITD